jgi:hypothetical protein
METETKVKEENKIKSPLVNRKIIVKLIDRQGSWLSQMNKQHDGANLWSSASITFTGVPFDLETGALRDPLTREERMWFESSESGLGLSKNEMSVLKKGNYWDNYSVSLNKEDKEIDLSTVNGYLDYKFLLAQVAIAPTWDERFDSAEYKFVLVDQRDKQKKDSKRALTKKDAYMELGKLSGSITDMKLFLTVYNLEKNTGKTVSNIANEDDLVSEISVIVEEDTNKFLEIIRDKDYETRAFIEHCIIKGGIEKVGKAKYTIMGEQEVFTLNQLIDFLKDVDNQAVYGKLRAITENKED